MYRWISPFVCAVVLLAAGAAAADDVVPAPGHCDGPVARRTVADGPST